MGFHRALSLNPHSGTFYIPEFISKWMNLYCTPINLFNYIVYYADDLCISFNTDRCYDFNLIGVIYHYLKQTIHELGLAFPASKCQFIVFGDHKVASKVQSLNLACDLPLTHTK